MERQDEDAELARRIASGDGAAFALVVRRHHAAVLRVARSYVRAAAAAEDVAQETWIGVMRGAHRFEGRSSLKSWILAIAVNCAKERHAREGRAIPFSALASGDDTSAVEPSRFRGESDPYPGHWISGGEPQSWDGAIEARLLTRELRLLLSDAITALPDAQRLVITLRDVEGLSGAETAAALGVTEANQRVLLHRARARVRAALERHFEKERGR
jgi:RNA polymerase sigma-70 factor (ECF subfamily)